MKLSATAVSAVLFAAVIGAAPMTANADPHGGHGGNRERATQFKHQQGWHGDIRAFPHHGSPHWRGGHWYHGHHGGRLGWWWVVGPSLWYYYPYYPYYPSVGYPYPDSYVPPVVADPNLPPPPQNWYFCNSAKTYYPYVQTCPEGWKTMPVTPDDAPPE